MAALQTQCLGGVCDVVLLALELAQNDASLHLIHSLLERAFFA
jgi:hypothetical protein